MKQKPATFALGLLAALLILGITFYLNPKKSDQTLPPLSHSVSGSNAPSGNIAITNPIVNFPSTPASNSDAIAPGCMLVTYHHKRTVNHADEEACSHHKNLLKVETQTKIIASSVCVRVNGRPVKYESVKGHSDQFMIGSIAGPQSEITIRYCTQTVCTFPKDDCKIARDEFMDAIGGQEEANTNAPKVKWDSKDTESDMSAEVDEVQRGLASMENLESGSTVFKDWLVDSKTPACGAKHAETASK